MSRKLEDTTAQDRVITAHRTQVLLPQDKLAHDVIWDLQLVPVETPPGSYDDRMGRDSIELMDKLLTSNRTSPELEELRTKAESEKEGTWQLRDGLLLRYGKLYVPDDQLTTGMPLRTALIKEAHEQPLMGHPGRAKL